MGKTTAALYFGLIALGLLMAALTNGALAWDGSYLFFVALDEQEPYIPHAQRFILLVGQGVTLLGSQWTDDVALLRFLFGFAFALLSFSILLLCWMIVKGRAPWLFLWPTLGIGIATLPRQITTYNEATIAMQLFWPLLLALLVGAERRWLPAIVVPAGLLLLAHPSAIPLIAFASGVAFLLALRHRAARTAYLRRAAFLGLVAAVTLIIFQLRKSPYESDALNVGVLAASFRDAVFGPMMVALALTYGAAGILFLVPTIRRRWVFPTASGRIPALYRVAILALAGAGLVLFVRMLIPRLWWTALDYRYWIVPSTLPFLAFAVLEAIAPPAWLDALRREMRARARAMVLVAAIFALALSANGLVWLRLTHRLEDTLATRTEACIPMSSLNWIRRTALNHWAISTYSLVLQGRHPTKIILPDEECAAAQTDGLSVTDWYTRPWGEGWFDLTALDQRLARSTSGS